MRNRRVSDVHDAVEALLPELRGRARDTEDARQVAPETMRALTETGLFTLLQPHRYGGLEADPVDFYAAARRLASACGSTGWVASVLGVHPWHLALFDDRAQQDVWGEDPGTLLSSAYAPMGRAVASDGGYFFSGRWSYSSGVAHVGWVLVGGFVVDDAGDPIDFRTFLIPARDYRVDDVWDTVGLRGTGSNDVVVEDAFVPEHRTLSFAATVQCRCPGKQINSSALYRLPFSAVFSTAIATPLVGMADGAYTAFVDQQAARRESNALRVPDDPFMHAALAESARDIDLAWMQLRANLDALRETAETGERIPLSLRIRTRRDQVGASGLAVAAIDRLFDFAGGAGLRSNAPLQRFWRDAHAGRAHVINDPHQALTLSGRSALGYDVRDAWV
ncbi:3-hydroxy-9,10-secoandrosta-1,3,5(10)-triene-9,17-dione monooxygenase oxygenase subunit [Prescottella sp. R16]|uniref:3-hydroxy-9,10-secoandrosta-1,3,5(10)-triene-9, 17-dione monooxygenase oxygenase subunit n=1 Tax=Prescottella sp. R16 TaxID=3064529 RepID=UPI00272E53D3|nr:3-hydroxy-9,10-secoandrosta-1,3,5(10)-triene-9,17-dione monooxygenase oxygenase subunit [Prescottella sp. R16]